MTQRDALTRGRGESRLAHFVVRPALAFLLALMLQAVVGAASAEGTPSPASPTPTPTKTVEATSTAIASATKSPTATPSPTPVPAQDLAVAFFNNFCDKGQPLMATIFNTSATPLAGRSVRLRLSTDSGVLEEHDHYLNLDPYSSVNLPLANTARTPWVQIEITLLGTPADPNPNNDSSGCGVPGEASESPQADVASGGRAGPAEGATNDTWRQPAPSQTPTPSTRQPARAVAGVTSNSPQPSLTPIGDAGGGLAPSAGGGFASRTLLLTGVVLLAGGSSWAFYYLTRPPKNA